MNIHVRRWGNSAAVRIPASALAGAKLKLDDAVTVREEDGRIVIEAAQEPPSITLEWLLEGFTPDQRHDEIDFGPPVGREVW